MYKLYNGDCLKYLKTLKDNEIDVLITDPPYGKKADKGTNGFGCSKNRRYNDNWDSKIPSEEIFNEMLRVSKKVIIFGANYFAHMLPPSKCWIFWDKKGDIALENYKNRLNEDIHRFSFVPNMADENFSNNSSGKNTMPLMLEIA